MTDNPVYYVFVVFVLGGMTAGSSMLDASYAPAFYGFAAPAVLPMVVGLFARGGFMLVEMALLLTAFAVVLVLMGRRTTDGSSKTSGCGSSSVSKLSAIS